MSSVPPPPSLPGVAQPSPPPPPIARADEELPPWPAWSGPVALVAALLIAVVGGLVVGLVGAGFGASLEDPPPAVNIVATFLQDAAFVLAAVLLARSFAPLLPAQLGFRRTPLRRAVGLAALTLVAFYVLSAAWAAALGITEESELPDGLGTEDSTAAFVAVCVLVTVAAPIAEEVLFRGFFFPALWRWCGPWLAAALTGLVFGAFHAGSTPAEFLVPLALLGFLLCLLRWRTGSLLPCMAVHAVNNAIAFSVTVAEWDAWQALLLILGANAAVLLVAAPLLRGAPARS